MSCQYRAVPLQGSAELMQCLIAFATFANLIGVMTEAPQPVGSTRSHGACCSADVVKGLPKLRGLTAMTTAQTHPSMYTLLCFLLRF